MVVCVINSDGLFKSITKSAGVEIQDQFTHKSFECFPFLTNGGQISAKKILFMKWLEPSKCDDYPKYRTKVRMLP